MDDSCIQLVHSLLKGSRALKRSFKVFTEPLPTANLATICNKLRTVEPQAVNEELASDVVP